MIGTLDSPRDPPRTAITGGTGFVGRRLLLSKAVRRVASVPDDLRPQRTAEQIRKSLPEPGDFGWQDLRISR